MWTPSDVGYDPSNLYRNNLAKYFLPSLNEWHKSAYYDPVSGVYYQFPTGSNSIPDGIDFVGDPSFDAVFNDGASNPGPNTITNVGLLSRYGTAGQGGNVSEWEETAFDRINTVAGEQRSDDGGAWISFSNILSAPQTGVGIVPTFELSSLGFRVASNVPEPDGIALLALGGLVVVSVYRRTRVAPTFGRLCAAIEQDLQRPNVGAA